MSYIAGLEIAPVWVAFATKSFAFATRNCQLVEVLRPTFDVQVIKTTEKSSILSVLILFAHMSYTKINFPQNFCTN